MITTRNNLYAEEDRILPWQSNYALQYYLIFVFYGEMLTPPKLRDFGLAVDFGFFSTHTITRFFGNQLVASKLLKKENKYCAK